MDQSNTIHLRWHKHQTNLVSVFDALLDNEKLTDCTISAEGRYLRAHKIILSACSPYFEELFTENYEKHPIIILHDVKYDMIKALMDFMYRGEVNIPQGELNGILKLSKSLQVRGLSGCRSVDDSNIEEGSGSYTPPESAETLPSQAASAERFVSSLNEEEVNVRPGSGCSPTESSPDESSMETDSISKSIQNHTKSIAQSCPEQGAGHNGGEETLTPDVDNLHQFSSQRQVMSTTCNSAGELVHSPHPVLKTKLLGTQSTASLSSPSSSCNPIPHQSQCSESQSTVQEMDTAVTENVLKPEAVLPEKRSANLSAHQPEQSTESKSEVLKSRVEIVEDLTCDDDDDDYSDGGAENKHFLITEVVEGDKRSPNMSSQPQDVTLETKSVLIKNKVEIVEDVNLDSDGSSSGADDSRDACNSTEVDMKDFRRVSEGLGHEEGFYTQGGDSQHSPFGSDCLNNMTGTSSSFVLRNRYSCPSCGRSYQYLRGLQRHMKYECHKKPQFQCHLCSYWFTRNDHLKRHLVSIHGQE